MYGMYFSFVLFCIAIYCNLLWWRDYYYHFFTYIHVLFSINVFKRKETLLCKATQFTVVENVCWSCDIDMYRWSCDIVMYICFYMVSVTITLEIFKLQYYVYYVLFDSSYKLLLYLSYKCCV